jgi:perosamine synthetase
MYTIRKANTSSSPAVLGGDREVTMNQADMFTWPIVTAEHEQAVLEVLRAGNMSGLDKTREFEKQFAKWHGVDYALACPNGTSAILESMYALGIGSGDEVICPTITFWASIIQAYMLRATPVFADIDPETLNIDPADIERKITPRTKAIVVVHYAGIPADMDAVMAIAKKHGLKVLEDCSHAHGALYNGKMAGTFGDVAAFSLMTGKAFAIGEGGILITKDSEIYQRSLLWGHYVRHNEITESRLKKYAGLPCGGAKNRMHQLTSAFGLVQMKMFPKQMQEIDKAMNYFCDQLEDVPGISTMRKVPYGTITKGGWYYPHFKYDKEKLGGVSLKRFAAALEAEGTVCNPGCNKPLHLHPLFTEMDVFNEGRPTKIANHPDPESVEPVQSLPIAESIVKQVFEVPWFKHFRKDVIDQHVNAYRKVIENIDLLADGDNDSQIEYGGYSSFFKSNANGK